MFAPKLYTVRKYPLSKIIQMNYNVLIGKKEEAFYHVKESDNQLFRQIRIISKEKLGVEPRDYNRYIVYVDIRQSADEEVLRRLVYEGFSINNQKFVLGERSASMTRNSILSFVDEEIAEELSEAVGMGIDPGKTVLSKYYAYRGLMMSACHMIEDWYPKVIVVPDYYRVIPNQKIRHLYDKEIEFVDKNGNQRTWVQKDVITGVRDIEVNCFDGCGIMHRDIAQYIKHAIGTGIDPTSVMVRFPFCKGVLHEVDYVRFYADRGITQIKDIWGLSHGVTARDEPMMILSESMYKGAKYFKKTKTIDDWNEYWKRFCKYNHCIGISKWNFSLEEEPVYTRANYQILQDLELPFDEFSSLAEYSLDWANSIVDDDLLAMYCSFGMFADKCKPLNCYTQAILKNPEMRKERGVRNYVVKVWQKKFDEMKMGKLWVRGCFKYLVPDLIMFMESAGGLEPNGCLESGEFYSLNENGVLLGEKLIERNPHLSVGEHQILTGVDPPEAKKYLGTLVNVAMLNSKSIVAQRLSGCDFDSRKVCPPVWQHIGVQLVNP